MCCKRTALFARRRIHEAESGAVYEYERFIFGAAVLGNGGLHVAGLAQRAWRPLPIHFGRVVRTDNRERRLMSMKKSRGYTLIELIVAVGLFALVMLLASGAYLFMIGLNRQAQGIATGIDNLSFALETITRNIRTGSAYNCAGIGDCFPSPRDSFTFVPAGGTAAVTYTRGTQSGPNGVVGSIVDSTGAVLTDPSVNVTSLAFYVTGTKNAQTTPDDFQQPHVTIVVTGSVTYGPQAGRTEAFNIQTGATMRGTDL